MEGTGRVASQVDGVAGLGRTVVPELLIEPHAPARDDVSGTPIGRPERLTSNSATNRQDGLRLSTNREADRPAPPRTPRERLAARWGSDSYQALWNGGLAIRPGNPLPPDLDLQLDCIRIGRWADIGKPNACLE